MCIVAGGGKPIHDGTVAVLNLKIPPDAQRGTARVSADRVVAVSSDLKRVALKRAESKVRIRAPKKR